MTSRTTSEKREHGLSDIELKGRSVQSHVGFSLFSLDKSGFRSRLEGRDEIARHVAWFLSAVENFRFIEPRISAFANPLEAVVQIKAKALIKPTRRVSRQEYVMFLLAKDAKIARMRQYFDPTRAARSMNESILDLEPWF